MTDIAARYARAADTYAAMWSPVIRPMAAPLLPALARVRGIVLDVGCGTGGLFDDIGRAAPGGRLVGCDLSEGMLRRARGVPRACADARTLPVRDDAVSAALAVFMLHHVPQPDRAIREMARVVAPGGLVATATWGAGSDHEAGAEWDAMLDDAGAARDVPAEDSREALDDADKAASLLARIGLFVEAAWTAVAEHRFDATALCDLHTQYGRRNQRWLSLPEPERTAVAARFRAAVDERPELCVWRPPVVYALATRP